MKLPKPTKRGYLPNIMNKTFKAQKLEEFRKKFVFVDNGPGGDGYDADLPTWNDYFLSLSKEDQVEYIEKFLSLLIDETTRMAVERERVVAKSSWKEIRIIDGNCDDIVISDVDAHLEDMTGNFWWLGLYRGNKRTTFHIISKSKIKVKVIENDLKCKFVDQPELSRKHDALTHAK